MRFSKHLQLASHWVKGEIFGDFHRGSSMARSFARGAFGRSGAPRLLNAKLVEAVGGQNHQAVSGSGSSGNVFLGFVGI